MPAEPEAEPEEIEEIPGEYLEDDSSFDYEPGDRKILLCDLKENMWHDRFCGWYDASLTKKGKEDTRDYAKRIKKSGILFNYAYTSALKRTKETVDIILQELGQTDIEVESHWLLNARHLGALTVEITNDLEKRIADQFEIFDHTLTKKVDVREIGTIIRSLGCVPTEAEIQEILLAVETIGAKGIVHLAKFMPHMSQIITEHRLQPAPPEKLLEAFRILDPERLGYISREELSKIMTEEGEPFTAEELEEMMAVAVDPQTDTIPYEYYINQLMFEPPGENDIYRLADRVESEKPPPPPPPKTFSQKLAESAKVQQEMED